MDFLIELVEYKSLKELISENTDATKFISLGFQKCNLLLLFFWNCPLILEKLKHPLGVGGVKFPTLRSTELLLTDTIAHKI